MRVEVTILYNPLTLMLLCPKMQENELASVVKQPVPVEYTHKELLFEW